MGADVRMKQIAETSPRLKARITGAGQGLGRDDGVR